ncbi:hypothetical protein K435DRAFT_806366 [Dendrothele bispora CBS 962.96]|uniref:Nucleoplasmin-like domain-containing protein n=1 Tax=Dendrothele bispora (strain CBS 962.96) TaxID=1314807 RepID=A0A4S8L867_DENBC|nr:hypothetical protein K435DRAFT_811600 [Dendrothele bispora CBS 962.96]THU84897.1 hypothetical protein K435DRAFT_806366 [Dendrothele bispora CBS 962.96]
MSFWNLNLAAGQGKMITPFRRLRLTNIALKEVIDYARTTVQIMKQQQPIADAAVIASLVPGRVDFSVIDVTLAPGVPMIITCVGPNPISIIGVAEDPRNAAHQVSDAPSIASIPSLHNASTALNQNGKRAVDDVDDAEDAPTSKRPNPGPEEAETSGRNKNGTRSRPNAGRAKEASKAKDKEAGKGKDKEAGKGKDKEAGK